MKRIKIDQDPECKVLEVNYASRTDKIIFDICDLNGGVVKMGKLEDGDNKIDISQLQEDRYKLLIIDGEEMLKEQFQVSRSG